jgi:diaminopropionate ammonia-lyase
VFLHEGVSSGREQAILALGAEVVRTAGDYDRSVVIASEQARRNGWQVISDTTDDPDDRGPAVIMQGYGTLVAEAVAQIGAVDGATPTHVFLQGGVGGLAAAVTAYLWELMGPERAPVFVVVEPVAADCLYQSARLGRPASASGDLDTLMAGLSCGEVSRAAWPILDLGAEFFMTIGDEAAIEAMRLLAGGALGDASIIAGESAVAGLAGLLAVAAHPEGADLMRLGPESSVLLIGSEGATDPEIFARIVEGVGATAS